MGGLTQNAEEPPSPHVFQSSTLKFKPVLTPVTPLGQGFCMILILLVERIVSVELMQVSLHMRASKAKKTYICMDVQRVKKCKNNHILPCLH